MTADDSDARLFGESPTSRQSRAVVAYKLIAKTANVMDQLQVVKHLLELDVNAATEILSNIVATLGGTYENAPAPPGPSSSASNPFMDDLFGVINNLAKVLPEDAIHIYTQIAAGPFPFVYRISAANSIAALDGPASGT